MYPDNQKESPRVAVDPECAADLLTYRIIQITETRNKTVERELHQMIKETLIQIGNPAMGVPMAVALSNRDVPTSILESLFHALGGIQVD